MKKLQIGFFISILIACGNRTLSRMYKTENSLNNIGLQEYLFRKKIPFVCKTEKLRIFTENSYPRIKPFFLAHKENDDNPLLKRHYYDNDLNFLDNTDNEIYNILQI